MSQFTIPGVDYLQCPANLGFRKTWPTAINLSSKHLEVRSLIYSHTEKSVHIIGVNQLNTLLLPH